MATKTADTPQADTPASTPGERSIGKDANISFNDTGATGSFNVNEQRGQSEDTIKNSIQKTEQAGVTRGRNQKGAPTNVSSPVSPQQVAPGPEVFSSSDAIETARTIDSHLGVEKKQGNTTPSLETKPQTPIASIKTPPATPGPSTREKNAPQKNGGRDRRPAQNTTLYSPPPPPPQQNAGEKVMKYTSEGGFLVGKISPRTQERTFAKTQVTSVEKGAKTERQNISNQENKNSRIQRINLAFRRFAQKAVQVLRIRPVEKKTPPPPPVKTAPDILPPKHRNMLFELLSSWNASKINQAKARGYNPNTLKEKILKEIIDIKTWGNRSWKDTKQFIANPITPVSTHSIVRETVRQKPKGEGLGSFLRSQWSAPEEDTDSATPSSSSGGYFNWSPSRVSQTFFNRPATSINRRFGGNFAERQLGGVGKSIAKNAAKKAGKQVAQKAATQAAEAGGKALIMNPPVLAGIAITVAALIFIGIMFFVIIQISGEQDNIINTGGGTTNPGTPGGPGTPNANPIPGFTLRKDPESPAVVTKDDQINYSISYTQPTSSVKLEDIIVYDKLPDNVTFQSASGINTYDAATNTVSWKLSDTGNTSPLKLIVIPKSDNITITNSAYALAAGAGGSGSLTGIFPPANTSPAEDAARQAFSSLVASHPDSVAAYKQASSQTGIPWEILAGIHNFETGGSLATNLSLVSGRKIGDDEPDVDRAGGCVANTTPGKPVPLLSGGCGFNSLLDSAIYAGNLLIGKNAGKIPTSFQDLVKVVYYYGGTGNSNCDEGLPYQTHCPRSFEGDDDPHAMNKYDIKHENMFLIYCADFTRCNPPQALERIGVITAADALTKYYK